MILVTENAKVELERLLTSNVDNPQAVLRLTLDEKGQLGLGVDVATPDDNVVERGGKNILIVEPALASRLETLMLDTEETPDGARLVVCNKSAD